MKKAFTLIELLIVVAIIAILAAIAVPNFLEAQTRSKVSRVKADMRSVATALEAYMVDYNHYPPCAPYPGFPSYPSNLLAYTPCITTPVAYMSSTNFVDPFVSYSKRGLTESLRYFNFEVYDGAAPYETWGDSEMTNEDPLRGFMLTSVGPDKVEGDVVHTYAKSAYTPENLIDGMDNGGIYDPTNGTVSSGDVVRLGGEVITGKAALIQ